MDVLVFFIVIVGGSLLMLGVFKLATSSGQGSADARFFGEPRNNSYSGVWEWLYWYSYKKELVSMKKATERLARYNKENNDTESRA